MQPEHTKMTADCYGSLVV